MSVKKPSSFSLNNFIILLCGLLFILNFMQENKIEQQKGLAGLQLSFTPFRAKASF